MNDSRVLALVRDLFFRTRIDAVAHAIGREVAYASTVDGAREFAERFKPVLVFADLSDPAFAPEVTLGAIRAGAPGARVIGFASHVDLKRLRSAREAGFDATFPKSEFSARLPELLRDARS